MRKRYQISVMAPPEWPHLPIFTEIAQLIQQSLLSLGYVAPLKFNKLLPSATNIVLGSFLMENPQILKTAPCVVYQLQPLVEEGQPFSPESFDHLRDAQMVWDYSLRNIEVLRAHGIENVRHVPFGYHPAMEKFKPAAEQDIDVLLYGAINQRRREVMEKLKEKCNAGLIFAAYGAQRDELLARSKIVINVHLHEGGILEQSRVSYLLNNGVFVVSEDAPDVPYESLITAPYDKLFETCLHYLDDSAERERLAKEAAEKFKAMRMQDLVAAALAE